MKVEVLIVLAMVMFWAAPVSQAQGYDQYGYNYQAHIFNGFYDNFSRPATPVASGPKLIMKWNEAWLSNQDRDGDGKLDRPTNYIGSGAWLTNHVITPNGDVYFVKIVAVPETAELIGGTWYDDNGEIGPEIWGSFAIVEEVVKGEGAIYLSPTGPALGKY